MTAAQEAELRSTFATKVDQVLAGSDPSAKSANKERAVLDKKHPGCADWSSLCDEGYDCHVYNCDDCFKINPIGVCYSYS